MFKHTKTIILSLSLVLALAACSPKPSGQEASPSHPSYSNLNSPSSLEEVRTLLSAHLDKDSVEEFLKLVKDYNDIVGPSGLKGDFTEFTETDYDVAKINPLWHEQKGDFIGTNCRINSYTLLKNTIEIPPVSQDDELLFMDNDAIDKGHVMDDKDKAAFNILFSRVKTEATQDVKVHAKRMAQFLSQFKFNDKVRMLSVVLHDNLDGDSLFIGHVGVLVPAKEGYLFLEKLTFEEPYQAIKFASKEEVYQYLGTKYSDYTGPGLAKPFIMDNDQWVEGAQ